MKPYKIKQRMFFYMYMNLYLYIPSKSDKTRYKLIAGQRIKNMYHGVNKW